MRVGVSVCECVCEYAVPVAKHIVPGLGGDKRAAYTQTKRIKIKGTLPQRFILYELSTKAVWWIRIRMDSELFPGS